jgi:hypothetical protein
MKLIYFLVLISMLITCCSAAPKVDTVATSVASTLAAQPTASPVVPTATYTPEPTATSTPIPLSEMDLEPILAVSGDLPAGYSAAQVRNDPPAMFNDVPAAANQIYLQFEQAGDAAGGAAVFVYDTVEEAEKAYSIIADGMGDDTKPVSDVGDKAQSVDYDLTMLGSISGQELLFLRCTTVVHIRFTGSDNLDYSIGYAKRLDGRLEPLVCR